MPINYEMFRESKKELRQELSSFFEHIKNFSHETYFYLKNHEEVDNDFWEKTNLSEEKADFLYDDVLNSAIWIIQQNQPRSSNLRYIICCINSSKELERVADYIVSITKFLKKRTLDKQTHKWFMDAFKKCVEILDNAYHLFENSDPYQSRKEIRIQLKDYEKYIKDQTRTMIKHFLTIKNDAQAQKTLIDTINAMNSLERIVTHTYNLIKSFNYIDV